MPKPALQPADFLDDAIALNCEVVDIRVVANVESKGYGFDPEDFPKTLFEAHHFSRLTGGKYDQSHPDLSAPNWTIGKKFYKDWRGEKARLARACALDRNAAFQSASWGTFQIMGFNFHECGCTDIQEFVNRMCGESNDHLSMFTSLMLSWKLAPALKAHKWEVVADRYNGKGQVAYYANLMRQEFTRLSRGSV